MHRAFLLGLLALLAPDGARAAWLEASSAHFVVYADDSERDVRAFSQLLERFHAALAVVTSTQVPKPSPSNRVTIYAVGSAREVRRLYGDDARYIAGFYVPRAGGSLAIVPRIATGATNPHFSMILLLHEYAHHFMNSAGGFPMQRWYSEGAAEFFASASFLPDGGVGVGRAAQHRAGELFLARDVRVEELLDPEAYETKRRSGPDAFYGKSWLLFHYLTFEPERRGQLSHYLQLLSQGRSSRDAGLEAFGDFHRLELELDAYMRKPQISMLQLPASVLETGPVEIRRLRAGEAAMMPVRIRSKRGVTVEQAQSLLPEARKIAARFPDDPAVLAALAEAEHDAGNDLEAIAAADAALATDSSQVNAYLQKGLSLFRMATHDADPGTAYARAREPFIALNRLENDHPLPLVYYYRSFIEAGTEPTPVARDGLRRAVELAPFDMGLRLILASQQIRDGQHVEARRNLVPVAFHPHGGELAAVVQQILVRMDSDPDWDGEDIVELMNSAAADDTGSPEQSRARSRQP